ncbi:MAG: glycosyltransferase family 2 protein [Gammaproteobacteria bacterium]
MHATGSQAPGAIAERGRAGWKLSFVIPCYNEGPNIRLLHSELTRAIVGLADDYEIIFVDDGSRDATLAEIRAVRAGDARVAYLSFSRNFGHEAASTAGLCHASGDAVVLMDADLQDPPETLAEMVRYWREGYDVVAAQRREREGENALKKAGSMGFYRLLMRLSAVEMPLDTGDFRLMDRRVVEAFKRMPEYHRFVRGMIAWLGFRQVLVSFDRRPRRAGDTKYGLRSLFGLSVTAISGFSVLPLRLATLLGTIAMLASIALAGIIVYQRIVLGMLVEGYAFMMVAILGLGAVQLLVLGIVGEYVGKIYSQTQRRPLYVIAESAGVAAKD